MSAARLSIAALVAAGACAVLAGPAAASSGPSVTMLDDCEPVSFDRALGPDSCLRNGNTTFEELFATLIDRRPDPIWRFEPGARSIHAGQQLDVRNHGGEFHTFTEVKKFGPGCLPEINELLFDQPIITPAPCNPDDTGAPAAFAADGVPPDGRRAVGGLASGTHLFQCMIHPWMEMTVTVKDD
jgi:plastocyanin